MNEKEKPFEELMSMTDRQMDDYYSGLPLATLARNYVDYQITKTKGNASVPEGYNEVLTFKEKLGRIKEDVHMAEYITLQEIDRIDLYYNHMRHFEAIKRAIWSRIDLFGIKKDIILQFEEEEDVEYSLLIMPSIRKIYSPDIKYGNEIEWSEEQLAALNKAKYEWNDQFYKRDVIN